MKGVVGGRGGHKGLLTWEGAVRKEQEADGPLIGTVIGD